MITPSDREFYRIEFKHDELFYKNLSAIRGQYTVQYGPMVYGLIHAINPGFMLETGTCQGYLTAWMAKASVELNHRKFITVDWYNEVFPHASPGSDFTIKENLSKCGVLEGVSEFIISETLSYFKYADDRGELNNLAFAVIDDCKEYKYLCEELAIVWKNLVPGGLLLVYGIEDQHSHEVQRAVNDTIKTPRRIQFFINSGFGIYQKNW